MLFVAVHGLFRAAVSMKFNVLIEILEKLAVNTVDMHIGLATYILAKLKHISSV